MTTKDKIIRHAHYIERYKSGQSKTIDKYLKRVDRVIRELLTRSNAIKSKKTLVAIQREARERILIIYKEWAKELDINLVDFAASEANFTARAVGQSMAIPSQHVLAAAIRSRPFTTVLLREELNNYTREQVRLIKNAISNGFYTGESNAEIIKNIRGTKANNFKDGILSIGKRKAERITRTAINHTSAQARLKLLEANSDLFTRYEWVATLDARTSNICKELDGKQWKIGKGRVPPAHPNCRSTITPVL
ncbi:MAG: hypothetical protein GY951_13865 [Psychromonas sp.]|nr:hypothetical protein [Psychromonas sp.]